MILDRPQFTLIRFILWVASGFVGIKSNGIVYEKWMSLLFF
jgi:hypothetical protein